MTDILYLQQLVELAESQQENLPPEEQEFLCGVKNLLTAIKKVGD